MTPFVKVIDLFRCEMWRVCMTKATMLVRTWVLNLTGSYKGVNEGEAPIGCARVLATAVKQLKLKKIFSMRSKVMIP